MTEARRESARGQWPGTRKPRCAGEERADGALRTSCDDGAMIPSRGSMPAASVLLPPHRLTRGEREVLHLLCQRLSDREIAERLFIGPLHAREHAPTSAKLGVSTGARPRRRDPTSDSSDDDWREPAGQRGRGAGVPRSAGRRRLTARRAGLRATGTAPPARGLTEAARSGLATALPSLMQAGTPSRPVLPERGDIPSSGPTGTGLGTEPTS